MSEERPAATSVEKIGIEHVPDQMRHGRPRRVFTIWFAANLTIADYVIGVLSTVAFGLTVRQALPLLLLGNLLGGAFLGLSAAMGPALGLPQMFSSRGSFGRRGNYIPGGLNWISTAGWFSVNTILATEAVRTLVPSANFVLTAAVLVAVQAVVAIYGYDLIHLFEEVMSVLLGALFVGVFVLILPQLSAALSYVPAGGSATAVALGSAGTVLAVSFSYIMSWSPYASDYSRYLPATSSRGRVALLALAGGGLASFGVEAIGAMVGALTGSLDYFPALNGFAGAYGWLAILAVVAGAVAANALNIYTNSLSALVLEVRAARWKTVVAGALVGFAVTVAAGASFEAFFENFLLALDYWITPWLGIVLVDFYLRHRRDPDTSLSAPGWRPGTLVVYSVAILVSVPFMVPPQALGYPVGALSWVFGGADFSYFISFAVAGLLQLLTGRKAG